MITILLSRPEIEEPTMIYVTKNAMVVKLDQSTMHDAKSFLEFVLR